MNHNCSSPVSVLYAALTRVPDLGNACVSTMFLPAPSEDGCVGASIVAQGGAGTHAAVAPQPLLSAAYFDPAFLNFIRSAVGPCRALWFCRIYGKKKPGLQAGQSLSEIGSRKP